LICADAADMPPGNFRNEYSEISYSSSGPPALHAQLCFPGPASRELGTTTGRGGLIHLTLGRRKTRGTSFKILKVLKDELHTKPIASREPWWYQRDTPVFRDDASHRSRSQTHAVEQPIPRLDRAGFIDERRR